ncbi:putative integral membrane protein [Babesia bovis T2Bo]|uniref:Membrane protein, putative n=1 Tax=Babesia bovis TaxID=5865 RepID=A7AU27_BABBO|nr:putative integral membrane protein [Babesia bovis T2Bo]EDO06438.1 putative integral membrane protein [Babesia bovis T2Bo]|eukprot:XP_001610006.1 membrane protein [Babesia bovis T2Bo]
MMRFIVIHALAITAITNCSGNAVESGEIKKIIAKVEQWKEQCKESDSAFKCMSNVWESHSELEDGSIGLYAWMETLPILRPNVAVLREFDAKNSATSEVYHEDETKCRNCICEHYRLDFNSFDAILRNNPNGGFMEDFRKVHSRRETEKIYTTKDYIIDCLDNIKPPSVVISGNAAHTTPFAELFDSQVHGRSDYGSMLTFLFLMEPYKLAKKVKAITLFKQSVDRYWIGRFRWNRITTSARVARYTLRYTQPGYVKYRISKYHLEDYIGNSLIVPYINIREPRVYQLLEGTGLDNPGQITSARQASKRFSRLISNLIRFLEIDGMETVEPFYIVEMRVRNPKYNLLDIMSANRIIKQPIRYNVVARPSGIRHMKKVFMLAEMFAVSIAVSVVAVAWVFYHLTHQIPQLKLESD